MIEKDRIIEVTNRDSGSVGYTIPDLNNLYRNFAPGETKRLTYEELEKLSWVKGGKKILEDYLIIQDKEVAEELLGDLEPEYFYTEDTVKKLLTEGTLAQLQDTLDFAPEGVLELIKKLAVELPVNSVVMRQEIKKKLHFDVDQAIYIKEESKKENSNENDATTSQRRAKPVAASEEKESSGRRTSIIK